MHISGTFSLSTPIWVLLERSFPPAEIKYTVPPESMDPSGCGKTSSLPRAPTSRPPRVKICSTAVKTSVTATLKIPRKTDEVIPQQSNVCESSRVAFFITVACKLHHNPESRNTLNGKSHSLHVDAYPRVWFALSKSTCTNFH